jgi:hypothetical protein
MEDATYVSESLTNTKKILYISMSVKKKSPALWGKRVRYNNVDEEGSFLLFFIDQSLFEIVHNGNRNSHCVFLSKRVGEAYIFLGVSLWTIVACPLSLGRVSGRPADGNGRHEKDSSLLAVPSLALRPYLFLMEMSRFGIGFKV